MGTAKRRTPLRLAVAAAAGLIGAGLLGGPALAHVEVEADNAQPGARNVTLTFTGEAESTSAGIASERVVLPAGIAPQDVRLAKAPTGWKLAANRDGFTVAGPALKTGQNAVFSVTVAQLPAGVTELAFKTLETYSDGKISRWIEIPQPGQPEPENPAPVLRLKPAAAAAPSSVPPTATSAAPSPTDPPPSGAATTPVATDSDNSHTGLWIALVAVVLAVGLVTGLLVLRRRRGSEGES